MPVMLLPRRPARLRPLQAPLALALALTVCPSLSLAEEPAQEEAVQRVLFIAKVVAVEPVEHKVRGEFKITEVLSGPKEPKGKRFYEEWPEWETLEVGEKSLWLGHWSAKGLVPVLDVLHCAFEYFLSPVWDRPGEPFDDAVKLARTVGREASLSGAERVRLWRECASSEVPIIAVWAIRSLVQHPDGRDAALHEVRQLLKDPRLPLRAQVQADNELGTWDKDKWLEEPTRLQMYDSWTKMKLSPTEAVMAVVGVENAWERDARRGKTYFALLSGYARNRGAPAKARESALSYLGLHLGDPDVGEGILDLMKEVLSGKFPEEMQIRAVIDLGKLPPEKDNVRRDLWRRAIQGDYRTSVRAYAMRCLCDHDKGKAGQALDVALRVLQASDEEEVQDWANLYIFNSVLSDAQVDELRSAMEKSKKKGFRQLMQQALKYHQERNSAKP